MQGDEITDVHQPSGLSQLMFMTACQGKSGLGSLTQLYLRLVGWEGKRVSACMRERKEERESQSLVNTLQKGCALGTLPKLTGLGCCEPHALE